MFFNMNKKVKLSEDTKHKTKTYTYMLPLLCKELGINTMHNLVNVYLRHEKYPEMTNHLFCLYTWDSSKFHTTYEGMLTSSPMCKIHEDVSSKHYIIGFEINENMQRDYDLFLEGKYSHISHDSKLQIIKYFGLNGNHVVVKVLRRDKELRKSLEEVLKAKIESTAELSSIIDIDNETFRQEFINEVNSPLPPLKVR